MRERIMRTKVTVNRADTISEDDRVCHFDELSDEAKDCLARIVQNGVTSVGSGPATELAQYDIVKFTEYYELTCEESTDRFKVSA